MAQLGGFLIEVSENADHKPLVRALLVQIDRAKFSHPAEPGDQIELTTRLVSALDIASQVDADASVRGTRIARARLTFMLKTIDSQALHEQRRRLYRLWTKGLQVRIP
jgi:3-hydroxymyristoyl/3-hydroxydecanoyl-(acyl carrier protein) dehydratase